MLEHCAVSVHVELTNQGYVFASFNLYSWSEQISIKFSSQKKKSKVVRRMEGIDRTKIVLFSTSNQNCQCYFQKYFQDQFVTWIQTCNEIYSSFKSPALTILTIRKVFWSSVVEKIVQNLSKFHYGPSERQSNIYCMVFLIQG